MANLTSSVLTVTIFVSLVSAIGGVPFNTMPLLLSSFGAELNMTATDKANLSSIAFFGYLLGTMAGPVWVDRVPWRGFSVLSATLAAVALIISANSSGVVLQASWLFFGLFCSFMHSLCMRILAEMPDEERAYGTRLSVELITISALLLVLPILFIDKYQYAGAAYALAGFIVILSLGTLFMPQRKDIASAREQITFPTWQKAGKAYVALGIFLIYCLANVGLWIFVGEIAMIHDPEPEQMSLLFSVLKVLGGLAGIIGAVIGARAGTRYPNIICFVIISTGSLGLMYSNTLTSVMMSTWVWEFGFTLGCIYQTAGIARHDISNRLVMLVPTAFAVSSFAGARVAGLMITENDYDNLYLFVILCSLAPAVYYYMLSTLERKHAH
ncbi:MAG: MFS transporter [Parvibaculales bacterium]